MATILPTYFLQAPQLPYGTHQLYQPELPYFSPDDLYQQQQQQPYPTDISPEESSDPILSLNLHVLRRHLRLTTSILFQAQYAVIYTFSPSGTGWEKSGKEGTLFIVRESTGGCALVVLNRRGLDNFVMRNWDSQVQSEGGHIILRGRVEGEGVASGVGGGGDVVKGEEQDDEGDLTVWGIWIWEEEGLGSTKGKRAGAEAWLVDCAKERELGLGKDGAEEQQEDGGWNANSEVFQEKEEPSESDDIVDDHHLNSEGTAMHAHLQQQQQHQRQHLLQQSHHQQWDNQNSNLYNPSHQYNHYQHPQPHYPNQPYHPNLHYPQNHHQPPQPFPHHQPPHPPPHAQPPYQQHLSHLHTPQQHPNHPTPTPTDGSGSPNLMALLNSAPHGGGVGITTAPAAGAGRDILGEIFGGGGR